MNFQIFLKVSPPLSEDDVESLEVGMTEIRALGGSGLGVGFLEGVGICFPGLWIMYTARWKLSGAFIRLALVVRCTTMYSPSGTIPSSE